MKTILVVDDNEDMRKIIKRILDKEGYETVLANDGDDCLVKLGKLEHKPDLILLDIMMPGKPVSDVLECIDDVKVAYFSAVTISERDKQCMLERKNVVDYIPKPFERDELVAKIKELVGE